MPRKDGKKLKGFYVDYKYTHDQQPYSTALTNTDMWNLVWRAVRAGDQYLYINRGNNYYA